jgi:multiple sugar transport system substrate-binding protein
VARSVNEAVHGFYRDTLTTLDRSWLRPRHHGYLKFQVDGSGAIDRLLDDWCTRRRRT